MTILIVWFGFWAGLGWLCGGVTGAVTGVVGAIGIILIAKIFG